jgi:hypothetical protein
MFSITLSMFSIALLDQICALPPSTNSSIPVTKLAPSDARNKAALATSSGSPMRPIGTVDTIRAITSADCRLTSGVLIGPGLTTLERIRRSFQVCRPGSHERPECSLARGIDAEGGSALNARDRAIENDRATVLQ